MFKKNHYKKILVAVAALVVLLMPAGVTTATNHSKFTLSFDANIALAQSTTPPTNWFSCLASNGNIATCGVYFVALTVDNFMTLGVALGAFLIRVGLQFNDNIYNSPAVQTGFSVTLALANLGFVLGIIVIAIATIIRNETYGMKQLLWKLVVMAILVNFGLVITAPIVGFASSLSNYFINATSPSTSSVAGYEGYVTTIAQAFAPQSVTQNLPGTGPGGSGTGCSGTTAGTNAICALQAKQNTNTTPANSFTQTVLALFFGIAFLALTTFTFFCIAILLIIRYLMLAGLLIVLPLAWLTFIIPKFDNSFSKWWNTFIKWTLFPPLALFFIYLAFITATNTGTGGTGSSTTPSSSGSAAYLAAAAGLPANANTGPEGAIVYQTGLGGPIQQAADEILLIGLTVMGLMFASSLSGKAGSTVVNGATHVSKAAAGYMGKKGKQMAGRAVPQKFKENLQAGKYRFAPKRLQVAAGVGLGNLEKKGRGDLVAEESASAEALAKDPKGFARILGAKAGSFGLGATSKPRQMAMLAQLANDEDLQKEVAKQGNMVGGMHLQEFLKKNEGGFKEFQQEKAYETLKDKSGLTPLELAEKSQDSEKTVLELGQKAKLQEIKDIQSKQKSGEALSGQEMATLSAHTEKYNALEYYEGMEKNGEGTMDEADKNELAAIRTMESNNADPMTQSEKIAYQKAKDTFDEANGKLKAWVAKNPDIAAESFQNHDKAKAKLEAEGKPVPLTFDPAAVKRVQQSILTAMAEGFSPQNAKGLIEAIGKKNNLKYFEGAMANMDAKTSAEIKSLAAGNKALATWIRNNPGKNIVDLNQMFGIKGNKKKKKEDDHDDEDDH